MKPKVEKKRLKPFPAVLRVRHRYLELELRGGPFRRSDVEEALWRMVIETTGVVGAAQADFSLVSFTEAPRGGVQKGILRADSQMLDGIRGTVCLLKEIKGAPCIARVSMVSGTLRPLK